MRVAYVDSSVIFRYYLVRDAGHREAVALLDDETTAIVTATLTHIEASGALVRAARAGLVDTTIVLARLDADLTEGRFTMVDADHAEVERVALGVVRQHGIRALDALHVAVASLVLPQLSSAFDEAVFVTRDDQQAAAAEALGLRLA